ncbi:GIY-YIG nuclease family protein [Rhodovarius crocodyli]|uniref:GIY-YIG nuclease family protein n=1 Tax=Rhodovarius crocodyli TaxID=1979269 RepID=A0A437MG00_9PROT|nr:GIY-YIG nuclease family protein [Rhodovarius crocodyli]RVT96586.1 GIY-YIG nuclease family protein [Rhodovarius crocodyli]
MSTALGRSLELFYIDGRPDGMLTAEMFNWTGHVLVAPRTQLAAALKRPQSRFTGIYLLLGEQEGEPRAYIGEGEDIGARITSHDAQKDWWTTALLVTTAANQLNKAHVRYLEARLIARAREINRTPLDNGTTPSLPGLSEADRAKMEAFIDNLLVVLPAVRVDMFIQRTRPAAPAGPQPATHPPTAAPSVPAPLATTPPATTPPIAEVPRFDLRSARLGLDATATLRDGTFWVEAGSTARARWEGQNGEAGTYLPLYNELVRAGVLAAQGEVRVFAQDYAFSSPSAAAAVVYGRSANGLTSWRLMGEGITYKEWEARQLSQATEDEA